MQPAREGAEGGGRKGMGVLPVTPGNKCPYPIREIHDNIECKFTQFRCGRDIKDGYQLKRGKGKR